MKRIPFIAGNWKMNLNQKQVKELIHGIHFGLRHPGEVDVLIAPSSVFLPLAADLTKDSYIEVAAQNVFCEEKGAFTGEISPAQLKDLGISWSILGHSERRAIFGETNSLINKKIKACFKNGVRPILCVGETLHEREAGMLNTVLSNQIREGLSDLTAAEVSSLIVAYEPVWAIGTGKVASPREAQDAHEIIRDLIRDLYSSDTAEKCRILYGGSVTAENAKELLALPDIDGALVGGASLKADSFISIIKSAVQ